MNALIWNARGLGSPKAFHELRRLIADTSPTLVFICETKVTNFICDNWRVRLGFSGQLVVDAIGKKGGLILWWKNEVVVSISSYSKGHIDCCINVGKNGWRFTGFYGNSDRNF